MIEKVNPSHPDKVADRIAGAIVDLAYTKEKNPKIAVEVLIGHSECNIIIETNVVVKKDEVNSILRRITKDDNIVLNLKVVPQDIELAKKPLYTTKANLERSGMGFTIMESFMDEMKVESIPEMGTKVTMKKYISTEQVNNEKIEEQSKLKEGI